MTGKALKYLFSILLSITLCAGVAGADSRYDKLMEKISSSKKGSGAISIYNDKDKVYLEVPRSLIGLKVMVNSYIRETSDSDVAIGSDVSGNNNMWIMDMMDSSIVLVRPNPMAIVTDGDSSVVKSLAGSRAEAVEKSMPIVGLGEGTYLFEADKIFDLSDKKVADFAGLDKGMMRVYESNLNSGKTLFRGTDAYGNSVAVINDADFNTKAALMMFSIEGNISVTVQTCLTLLENRPFSIRLADGRVGVPSVKVDMISASRGIVEKQSAIRWNLDTLSELRVYMDTLLSPSWQKAVKEGIEAWQPAFTGIGKTLTIKVEPFPADSSFNVCDPLKNIVLLARSDGERLNGRYSVDKVTGEILGFGLTVPIGIAGGVRKEGSMAIADVDTRYREFYICDEAVCDVLRAQTMSIFGRLLGLKRNYAGSYAYSPAQISDPVFVKANGFTASVTDDVLFNTFAKPGDKEKGLPLIIEKPGKYDLYAINWLYGDFHSDDDLRSFVDEHQGNPEYLYLAESTTVGKNNDPRAFAYDLGNDPMAWYDAAMGHLKAAAEYAPSYLVDNVTNRAFNDLYIEWMWLKASRYSQVLACQVGGIYYNDVRVGSSLPRCQTIPEDMQLAAMRKAFYGLKDASWLNDKDFLHLSGALKSVDGMTNMNASNGPGLLLRLGNVSVSEKCGSSFTREKYMQELQSLFLADASKGILHEQEDNMIAFYLGWLSGLSPLSKAIQDDNNHSGALATDIRSSYDSASAIYSGENATIARAYLRKAVKMLEKGARRAKDSDVRGRLLFLSKYYSSEIH